MSLIVCDVFSLCRCCGTGLLLTKKQIFSDVKEERTEEVSLFITAVIVMMSSLLWGRWRSDLADSNYCPTYSYCVALFLWAVCRLCPDEIIGGAEPGVDLHVISL